MMKFTGTALKQAILRFARNESAATAIEYAMIASGVGVAIAATVVNLGTTVNGLFANVSTSLK
jgi:pilus assembly protein Flp/PilA